MLATAKILGSSDLLPGNPAHASTSLRYNARRPSLGSSRHLGCSDVATNMRRSLILFTAHRCRTPKFEEFELEQWKVYRLFFPGFYLLGRSKDTFSKHMDRFSSSGFVFLVFSACISSCIAFYLPGLAPVTYCEPPGKQTNPACLVGAVVLALALHLYFAVWLFHLIFWRLKF